MSEDPDVESGAPAESDTEVAEPSDQPKEEMSDVEERRRDPFVRERIDDSEPIGQ